MYVGIDLVNVIGILIYVVFDGVVIDVGFIVGYGMWVKLLYVDGMVMLYGYVNIMLVSVGECVMVGD